MTLAAITALIMTLKPVSRITSQPFPQVATQA